GVECAPRQRSPPRSCHAKLAGFIKQRPVVRRLRKIVSWREAKPLNVHGKCPKHVILAPIAAKERTLETPLGARQHPHYGRTELCRKELAYGHIVRSGEGRPTTPWPAPVVRRHLDYRRRLAALRTQDCACR